MLMHHCWVTTLLSPWRGAAFQTTHLPAGHQGSLGQKDSALIGSPSSGDSHARNPRARQDLKLLFHKKRQGDSQLLMSLSPFLAGSVRFGQNHSITLTEYRELPASVLSYPSSIPSPLVHHTSAHRKKKEDESIGCSF